MTEEERQKTILELEREVLDYKPWNSKQNKQNRKKAKCKVCGSELINGDCPEHAVHIRMHHQYLQRVRNQHE